MADTKRRYAVWGGVGLLLLGALLWWSLTRESGAPPLAPPKPDTVAATSARPETPGAQPALAQREQATPASTPLLKLPAARRTEAPEGTPGAFSGRVVSAVSGQGVPGAELTFSGPVGATSLRTDEAGGFHFTPDREGLWQLASVLADGFLPFGPDWGQSPVRLTARLGSGVEGLLLALTPEDVWTVRVEDGAGRPLAGARVRLFSSRSGESVLFPTEDTFTTGANGEARLRAPEGSTVEARHPGHAPGRAELGQLVTERRVVLKLKAEAVEAREVLSGRVVDESGAGIAGAGVWAEPPRGTRLPGSEGGGAPMAQALTDDEGRFLLEGLAPGTYDVSAAILGRVKTTERKVRAGGKDLVLVLSRGARLTGRVRGERGAPVASFRLGLDLHVGPLERDQGTTLTVVDVEGRFTVEGLSPGTYTLRAAAHGLAPAAMRIEVAPKAVDVGPVEVTLGPGVRLEGQVVRTGGAPLTGARVTVEGGAYGASLDTLYDGMTDASGRFSVEGLAPGEVSLSVSARGHNTRIVNGVRVGPGAPPVPPVELEPVAEGETEKVEMVGIGAVLGPRDDALVLGQIFPGGGAHEAGLQPGDAIVRIEGTPVVDIGFAEAVPRIRGPEGSQLRLGIRRAGSSDVVDLVVTRRKVKL